MIERAFRLQHSINSAGHYNNSSVCFLCPAHQSLSVLYLLVSSENYFEKQQLFWRKTEGKHCFFSRFLDYRNVSICS